AGLIEQTKAGIVQAQQALDNAATPEESAAAQQQYDLLSGNLTALEAEQKKAEIGKTEATGALDGIAAATAGLRQLDAAKTQLDAGDKELAAGQKTLNSKK
ncbi:MAG: hypothetical protein ACRD08_14015, partial [Acidimicrobiales bacterium]